MIEITLNNGALFICENLDEVKSVKEYALSYGYSIENEFENSQEIKPSKNKINGKRCYI